MNRHGSPADRSPHQWQRDIARSAALLLVVGVCIGCSPGVHHMYLGPERPDAEIAMIAAGVKGLGIRAVDGERTRSSGGNPVREVKVLPGEHSILVRRVVPATVVYSGFRADAILLLDAVAGHRYSIHCERNLAGAGFWIEDEETGRIVTSASPQ